jgi:hypothetical protein
MMIQSAFDRLARRSEARTNCFDDRALVKSVTDFRKQIRTKLVGMLTWTRPFTLAPLLGSTTCTHSSSHKVCGIFGFEIRKISEA